MAAAAPFIVAPPPEFAHGARTLPRAHRHAHPVLHEAPEHALEATPDEMEAHSTPTPPVVSSAPNNAVSVNRPTKTDAARDSVARKGSIGGGSGVGVTAADGGGGEGEEKKEGDEDGPFPVYLDRIGTAV